MQQSDHHIINTFRSKRLQDSVKKIFTQVVELLAAKGVLSIKDIYVDATRIKANANRYTFVRSNAIKEESKEKIKKQLAQNLRKIAVLKAAKRDFPFTFCAVRTQ